MRVPKHLPWILLAVLALIQLWALPGDYLGREHDDAQYVLASLALLRGEYSLGISPGNPPLTFATPGFPILLMPAAAAFRGSFGVFHFNAWLWLALCDVLTWLWLRRRLEGPAALLCTALFALNPLVLARAGKVMTEIPFLAMTLGLCLALELPGWPGWASGVWLGYAWLVRQPAVALFPVAWGWHAFKQRSWKSAAAAAAVPAAVVGAWSWWLSTVGERMGEIDELGWAYGGRPREILHTLVANAVYYSSLWGRTWLPWPPGGRAPEAAVGAALLAASAWGARRILRRRPWDPALLWLLSGGLMHAFWPYEYERYLVVFIPMLVWTSWEGVDAALEAIFPPDSAVSRAGVRGAGASRWTFAGFAVVLAAQFVGQGRLLLGESRGRSRPELSDTYAWIRSNVPARDAISSIWYMRDALYGGHPFAPLPDPAPPEELARWLRARGIRYVLLQEPGDVGSSLGSRFGPLTALPRLRRSLGSPVFQVAYANDAERSVLYRLADASASHDDPAGGM